MGSLVFSEESLLIQNLLKRSLATAEKEPLVASRDLEA